MSKLLVVESPTKEKTISRFLQALNQSGSGQGDFIIKSSYGHVRDLPEKKLGVNIEKNFQPNYVILSKTKKILSSLKKLSTAAEKIYLATDYDREGEAIAWHLIELLKPDKEKVKRITFHEITPEAILEALKNPREIDLNLVNAQQARRILDRLVGYKISPLLWRKVKSGLSAGRVQSVALRLICDREEEITKFKPQEYWTITAQLSKIETEENFLAELVEYENKKLEKLSISDEKQVEKIVSSLQGLPYWVNKVLFKEKKRGPLPPFTTATLQQESARKLFFSANKTMFLAQQLYEGIELGSEFSEGGMVGLITYHRTDSYQVAESARNEAVKYITGKYGVEFLPAKPRIYKTKIKGAQEAHEAIRPTSVYREPEKIKDYLTPDQLKLYVLIWQRFLASQMADAIFDTMTVDISAGNLGMHQSGAYLGIFRATGQKIKFPGFLKIYDLNEEKERILPQLDEGENLHLLKLIPGQHFTEPPAKYNEASLIKTLEKYGIGRPSTYAPIISTIIERKYVELKERKFYPTELGKTINELVKRHFPKIVDINFTAEMEKNLDEIARGKINWTAMLNNFYSSFSQILKLAEEEMEKLRSPAEKTEEICSECGAMMLLRNSRYGKFLSCSRYPACKNKIALDKQGRKIIPQKTEEKCEKCGRMMLLRSGPRGNFLACSGFPKCKNTRSYKG